MLKQRNFKENNSGFARKHSQKCVQCIAAVNYLKITTIKSFVFSFCLKSKQVYKMKHNIFARKLK